MYSRCKRISFAETGTLPRPPFRRAPFALSSRGRISIRRSPADEILVTKPQRLPNTHPVSNSSANRNRSHSRCCASRIACTCSELHTRGSRSTSRNRPTGRAARSCDAVQKRLVATVPRAAAGNQLAGERHAAAGMELVEAEHRAQRPVHRTRRPRRRPVLKHDHVLRRLAKPRRELAQDLQAHPIPRDLSNRQERDEQLQVARLRADRVGRLLDVRQPRQTAINRLHRRRSTPMTVHDSRPRSTTRGTRQLPCATNITTDGRSRAGRTAPALIRLPQGAITESAVPRVSPPLPPRPDRGSHRSRLSGPLMPNLAAQRQRARPSL